MYISNVQFKLSYATIIQYNGALGQGWTLSIAQSDIMNLGCRLMNAF